MSKDGGNNLNEPKDLTNKINPKNDSKTTDEKNGKMKKCLIKITPIIKSELNAINLFKSLCNIRIESQGEIIIGTGFLLKFLIYQECFCCLVSNGYILKEDVINNKKNIHIYYDKEKNENDSEFDGSKRYIKNFKDYGIDITIIEILKDDNISKDYFLWSEFETENDKLINKEIYIPKFEQENTLIAVEGKIININKYEFLYSTNEKIDSFGCPIFFINNIDILGIHNKDSKNKGEYFGYFFYHLIDIIKNDINKRRNNVKCINGKYIYEDGTYYIGEFKDNIPNGKGIKYYLNGNILYEGDFINGKFEGKGKYIYDNGYYFIGEYKNGIRNGKGIKYYPNGKILYECEFIDGKAEGNGKFIYEDGSSYIGQYKNNFRNGKGIFYYPNGKINYEGDWSNGRKDGFGKFIYEDDKYYYIGQWKNDLMHGKGILFYENGKICYKGEYINGRPNGIGYHFFDNGEYYIGQFQESLRHGKGTMYNSNGTIKEEGNWNNNIFIAN